MPLQPNAPVIAERPDGTVRISWNAVSLSSTYFVKVRLVAGRWQSVDASVSPAVLVPSGWNAVRAPATEVTKEANELFIFENE